MKIVKDYQINDKRICTTKYLSQNFTK